MLFKATGETGNGLIHAKEALEYIERNMHQLEDVSAAVRFYLHPLPWAPFRLFYSYYDYLERAQLGAHGHAMYMHVQTIVK